MSCFFHLHYPKSLLSFLLGFQTSSILWTGTSQSSHESSWTQAKNTMRHTLLVRLKMIFLLPFGEIWTNVPWVKKNSNPETLK